MAITLTEDATLRIRTLLDQQPFNRDALNFGVKGAGCSGYMYVLDFIDSDNIDTSTYTIFESNGIKIFIDNEALPLIDGTEIDYENKGFNMFFTFNNPQANNKCGCGESFTVG